MAAAGLQGPSEVSARSVNSCGKEQLCPNTDSHERATQVLEGLASWSAVASVVGERDLPEGEMGEEGGAAADPAESGGWENQCTEMWTWLVCQPEGSLPPHGLL